MFKKILLGVGVAFVGLIILSVALSGSESTTDTPVDEAPPVAEAPVAVEPAPVVANDECYITASCPLQNGWSALGWTAFTGGLLTGLGQGNTPEAEALAGCVADAFMLRMTTTEFLSLSDTELENLAFDIKFNECSSLLPNTH